MPLQKSGVQFVLPSSIIGYTAILSWWGWNSEPNATRQARLEAEAKRKL
jgi:hypothetical protein